MLCISAASAVARCLSARLSVCPSVTFVDSVEMNKRIFNLFHHRVATMPHHSSFSVPNVMAILRRWPPSGGRQKSRFSANITLSDRWLLECEQQLRRSIVQFTAQTATHQWILLIRWTQENRTEFICTQHFPGTYPPGYIPRTFPPPGQFRLFLPRDAYA